MATGFSPLGASAYSNLPRSAIVQPARDWRFYENSIMALDASKGTLLKEYKESGVWKDHYKTWKDACIPLELSASQVNRLIAEATIINAECVKLSPQQKKQTLKAIAKLPEPPEEPEKPHIRTKDEIEAEQKEQDKATVKPTENGKPKYHLAIWRELEESLFGRALNRIDELNKQCPNPTDHYRLIKAAKLCLSILSEWRDAIK